MLGCIHPMSSPLMKRMLGFCCCCADADGIHAVVAARSVNAASQMTLVSRIPRFLMLAARDGPAACARSQCAESHDSTGISLFSICFGFTGASVVFTYSVPALLRA